MKKNLFYYLFAVICSACIFTSCSDDDDDTKSGTYEGENLSLTFDEVPLSGKSARLEGNTLTITNLLPGEPTLAMAVSFDGDKIEGINSNTYRDVKVSGSISNNKMNANVTVTSKVSDLIGTWTLPDLNTTGVPALYFALKTSKTEVEFGDQKETPETVQNFVSYMGSSMLPMFLRDITFAEDGNITASYNSDMSTPAYTTSPKGMAFYNVVDGKLFISINVAGIIADTSKERATNDLSGMTELIALAEQGIPFTMENKDGYMKVYIGKDLLTKVTPLFPLLVNMMPTDYQFYGKILVQLGTIIDESTSADLGLTVSKAKE